MGEPRSVCAVALLTETTKSVSVFNQLWLDEHTFNPFPIKQSLRSMTLSRIRLNFASMNALQIKGLADILVVEWILHNEEISFRLNDPRF